MASVHQLADVGQQHKEQDLDDQLSQSVSRKQTAL